MVLAKLMYFSVHSLCSPLKIESNSPTALGILYESFVFDKCMHIESFVIDENMRGKGVGAMLMAASENFAKENGCEFIDLITLSRRRKDGTHNFYEKMGFQDQDGAGLTHFSKILTEFKLPLN